MAAENLTHAKSMIRLFMGYIPTQVIYVAAKLGLAEHIRADGSSARELAQKLNVEAVLYVFDNPSRREHILLTDVEKDAKRERGNQAVRGLAFGLALEFDSKYKGKGAV